MLIAHQKYSCLFVVIMTFSISVNAVEDSNQSAIQKLEEQSFTDYNEVTGVIIDRTITRLGDDFYKPFSLLINSRFDALEINLIVKERPTAMSGSIISVIHRNTVIFRTAITPGRKATEEEVKRAVSVVSSHINKWKLERMIGDTFDLAHDEF